MCLLYLGWTFPEPWQGPCLSQHICFLHLMPLTYKMAVEINKFLFGPYLLLKVSARPLLKHIEVRHSQEAVPYGDFFID